MKFTPLGIKNLPKPPGISKLIGPSFIILGMGLGSGELILWPYLSSNFGLGIAWVAVIGITFQFFINMEIQRYTLINGESVFVGLARKHGLFSPIWFIISTFVPWMWPGIIAACGTLLAAAMGIEFSGIIGIILLLAIGVLYSLGSVVYKTQEQIQKLIIFVGVPFVFAVTLYFSGVSDWQALGVGLIGQGEGYTFLPAAIPMATLLGAFVYAGAGGNLNLSQSLYAKEKGYGMGAYSGRITNVLSGKQEEVSLEGSTFEPTVENLKTFRLWWKRINTEHLLLFWATGAFTMLMLMLLSYSTVYGISGVDSSINFVISEALVFSEKTIPFVGTFFLIMASVMLFGTQFSVLGSNARIMCENLIILNSKRFRVSSISKYFYRFLWLQILAGIGIFALGFTEPLALVVVGAVLNAVSMFIYTGMILHLNKTVLHEKLQPSIIRTTIVFVAFLVYGAFSVYTIYRYLG